MRRAWPLLLLLLAPPATAGLFGSDAPGRIPVPARDVAVEVEDVGGTRAALTRFTFDGEVYLYGNLGHALVTVAFEDIARVMFEAGPDEETRTAVVETKAGEVVRVAVEDDKPLYGRTTYGNYRIEVRDVRAIAF